mmetsp:Transcript_13107/g.31043  ORF Transcript_13107/g.31043 Transcript_13107/m.31043 type:complete len:158 (+) Transcript_13107:116-589(+)
MVPIQDQIEQSIIDRIQTMTTSPQHNVDDAESSWNCIIPCSPIIDAIMIGDTTNPKPLPRKSCLASKNPKKKSVSIGTDNKEGCMTSPHVLFRQPTRWAASEATDSMPRIPSRQTSSAEPSSGSESSLDEVIANFVSNIRAEPRTTRKRNSLASKAA